MITKLVMTQFNVQNDRTMSKNGKSLGRWQGKDRQQKLLFKIRRSGNPGMFYSG